jgi:hypothetical protein
MASDASVMIFLPASGAHACAISLKETGGRISAC